MCRCCLLGDKIWNLNPAIPSVLYLPCKHSHTELCRNVEEREHEREMEKPRKVKESWEEDRSPPQHALNTHRANSKDTQCSTGASLSARTQTDRFIQTQPQEGCAHHPAHYKDTTDLQKSSEWEMLRNSASYTGTHAGEEAAVRVCGVEVHSVAQGWLAQYRGSARNLFQLCNSSLQWN